MGQRQLSLMNAGPTKPESSPRDGSSIFISFERSQRVTGLCGHASYELPDLKSHVSAPKSPTDV